jgi:hypothetical protein
MCVGQASSIQTIASGALPDNTFVKVTGAIVTSPKFQLTAGCLWGVFVKDPIANAGSLIVSTGGTTPFDGGSVCAPGTDQLPQGLQPGDIVAIGGRVVRYTPPSCVGVPPVIEVVVEAAEGCSASKIGVGPQPVPMTVSPADLVGGAQYANQLVRVINVMAQDWPDGGVTDKYGSILLDGSNLVVRDAIFYRAQGAPLFSSGQMFNEVVGINGQPIVANGLCSWTLLPRDKCIDYDPKSQDCP